MQIDAWLRYGPGNEQGWGVCTGVPTPSLVAVAGPARGTGDHRDAGGWRILALTAEIWHNHHPVTRPPTAPE